MPTHVLVPIFVSSVNFYKGSLFWIILKCQESSWNPAVSPESILRVSFLILFWIFLEDFLCHWFFTFSGSYRVNPCEIDKIWMTRRNCTTSGWSFWRSWTTTYTRLKEEGSLDNLEGQIFKNCHPVLMWRNAWTKKGFLRHIWRPCHDS